MDGARAKFTKTNDAFGFFELSLLVAFNLAH